MSEQSDPLIEKLVRRLEDEDPAMRRNAAGALRLHGSRAVSAIPILVDLLNDDDPTVREEARKAVDRLRNAAA